MPPRRSRVVRKSSGKHARDDENASASNKRMRLGKGALQEPSLDDPLGSHPSEKTRAVFELFDTDLLRTWLLHHDNWKELLADAKTATREALLSALVLWAAPPKGRGKQPQLKAMQEVWMEIRNQAAAGAPGFYVAPSVKESDDASEPDSDAEAVNIEQGRSAAAARMKAVQPGAAHAAVAHVAAAAASPAQVVHPFEDGCMTCLLKPLPSTVSLKGQWNCVCGLRGDLPIESAVNMHLAAKMAAAAASAKGSSAASSSDGQSQKDTPSADLDKLEKYLTRLLEHHGDVHPMFSKGAKAPSPEEALLTSRLALGGSQTEMPPPLLLKLIQAGKLLDVALARPRPFFRDAGSMEHAMTISFGASGPTVNTTKDPTKPQALASVEEFCMALFSTILPALIDRPAAMIEWIALARTTVEMSTLHGWPAAMHYTEALLRERICTSAKKGFAEPSTSAMRDVQRGKDHTGGGAQRLGGGSFNGILPQKQRGTCHGFQRNTCRRPDCSFAHTCAACGGNHAAVANPTCAKVVSAQGVAGSSKGRAGGRGGGGSSRPPPTSGGTGAGSVKTGPATD
jgi:hypothetical protein